MSTSTSRAGRRYPESVAVNVRNRSHELVVDVTIPDPPGATDGVLLALGSVLGGWSLHILGGHIRYVHNLYGKERHVIESVETVTPGDHRIEYAFAKDAQAWAAPACCVTTTAKSGAG